MTVAGDITPDANATRSIGTPSYRFDKGYFVGGVVTGNASTTYSDNLITFGGGSKIKDVSSKLQLQAGYVIGKALEPWTPDSGKDKIEVLINLGWYDGNNSATLQQLLEQSKEIQQLKLENGRLRARIERLESLLNK